MAIIKNEETKKMFLEVLRMHFEEKKSYAEIGELYNKGKDYIYKLVKTYKGEYNISERLSVYDYLKLTDRLEKVFELYRSGVSMAQIGERYGVTERTVASWLKKNDVLIRLPGVISKIDQDLFEKIDSEIKAYTLGLLLSDGNVSAKSATISITLAQDDGYILEEINERLLGCQGNICIEHFEDIKPRKKLQFNGKALKQRLASYGCIPCKSRTLAQLPLNIPNELYHHFLRGLYDGDGVCSFYTSRKERRVRIGFCAANREFVEDYQRFFVENLKMKKTKLFNTSGCWQCSWGAKRDLQSFFDYIYKDATIYLGRKYKKLKDFLTQ